MFLVIGERAGADDKTRIARGAKDKRHRPPPAAAATATTAAAGGAETGASPPKQRRHDAATERCAARQHQRHEPHEPQTGDAHFVSRGRRCTGTPATDH